MDEMRSGIIPDAHKKAFGSYMSFDDKPISPGCIACKSGEWLCAFVGTNCNCKCEGCHNPNVNKGEVSKLTGIRGDVSTCTGINGEVNIDMMLELLAKHKFTGVGISGGEPLMYVDKMIDWITKIKKHHPDIYIWNYTNGVYADTNTLKKLADAGLDEIRFDLVADNFSGTVMRNMANAVKIIPSVGIEVPVILEQYNQLANAIKIADAVGVKYVNLHDLYVNEKMYKNGLGGYKRYYEKLSGVQRDVYASAILIYRLFRMIKDENMSIVPNDCTIINMQLQHFSFKYQEYNIANPGIMSFNDYMTMMFKQHDSKDIILNAGVI